MGTGAATPPEPPGRQSAKLDIEKLAGFRLDYLLSNAISLALSFTLAAWGYPHSPEAVARLFGRPVRSAFSASGQKDDH